MEKEVQFPKKCKSMCDITDAVPCNVAIYASRDDFRRHRRVDRSSSESTSEEGAEARGPGPDVSRARCSDNGFADSGVGDHSGVGDNGGRGGDAIAGLEHKIDRLYDLFEEQCHLLTTLKEDIHNSKAAMEKVEQHQTDSLAEFVKKTISNMEAKDEEGAGPETNSRARSLLAAIEARQGSAPHDLRDALTSFLQSEELKEQMVSATAQSVRAVVGDCLSRDLASLYLPLLEHSHRRLLDQLGRTVEDAFVELEEKSATLSRSVCKISRSLRRAVERHRRLLEAPPGSLSALHCALQQLLHKELQEWRQKVLNVLAEPPAEAGVTPEPLAGGLLAAEPPHAEESLASLPPPPDTERLAFEQLMQCAEIRQQLERGEVQAAFSRALSAGSLAQLRAAVRAGAAAFRPRCRLRQPELLALLQQLSTDVAHDTLLKCRFIEDSIINLDRDHPATRAHLPLVVGEVRRHLSRFLASYPAHVHGRRIALIIMAADNLLK